jgi:hypothetical protein
VEVGQQRVDDAEPGAGVTGTCSVRFQNEMPPWRPSFGWPGLAAGSRPTCFTTPSVCNIPGRGHLLRRRIPRVARFLG